MQAVADRPEQLLTLAQASFGADAPVGLHGQRDEIAHRSGEHLLHGAPLPRRPDVLVADDARELSTLIERRVEERRNAPRLQIAAQLAGARVVPGVEGGDGAELGEGREVRGGLGRQDLVAFRVLVGLARVGLDAPHARPLAVEHPDVHPLDPEGSGGGLGDGAQDAGEVTVFHDRAPRQPGQDASEVCRRPHPCLPSRRTLP